MIPVPIDDAVDNQIANVRDVANSRGVEIRVKRTAPGSVVLAIPEVFEIVLGNILKNAVTFTDKGLVEVVVAPGKIIVRDFGPGVAQSVQATLFDRFSRGTRRDGNGVGIGLALVRRFCEEYGWSIDFQSDERQGTRVALAF